MITDNYFIVWSCGFEYLSEILDIIRNHPSIKITRIFKRSFSFDSNFFHELYKLDKRVSNELIELKTTYLKKYKPEMYLIFVKDLNNIYKIKNGDFKYSYNVTFLKWKIRLLFNPRENNVPLRPIITDEQVSKSTIQQWWYDGVSHNHIIHANDLEEETPVIIKYFNLENEDFTLQGHCYHNLPKKITNVSIDNILCNTLHKDGVHITETPHYNFLLGQREEYEKYILEGLERKIITYDNLSGSYDKLIKEFNYGIEIDGVPQYVIAKKVKNSSKYEGLDGGHRLAILYHKGIRNINIWELI